jgi:hypothetical protein
MTPGAGDDLPEVRRNAPVFPSKACSQGPCAEPHRWQELHIPTGNPLVEYDQWWQCGEAGPS